MTGEISLDALVSRYLEQHRRGQPVTPEELCQDCPEYLEALRERLEVMDSMEEFLQLTGGIDLDRVVFGCTQAPGEAEKKPGIPEGPTRPADKAQPPGEPTRALLGEPGGAVLRKPQHCPEDYELLSQLGEGGMGVVYKARQKSLNRVVALKMILHQGKNVPLMVTRFRREAEAIARLQHPGIVQVYDFGEEEGIPYFALEFVEGGTLDRQIAGTPQPALASARLLVSLAEAMHAAHEKEIIHRDLKPANVLLRRKPDSRSSKSDARNSKGETHRPKSDTKADAIPLESPPQLDELEPKVTDFGLAKLLDEEHGQTRTGAVMGTPSYMAPEQAAGQNEHTGAWTDVWALGAILYECLTGRPPFKGETVFDTLFLVREQDPVPPSRLAPKVPKDLETVCLKCLQKNPRARYHTAQDLADDLKRILNHEPIHARPVSAPERVRKWARRHPGKATLYAGLLLFLASLPLIIIALFALLNAERTKVKDGERQLQIEERKREIATAYSLARKALVEAREEARKWNWKVVDKKLGEARALTSKFEELQELHAEVKALIDRFEKARGQIAKFTSERDRVLSELQRIMARDQSLDRNQVLASAGEALKVVGLTLEGEPRLDVDEGVFDEAARKKLLQEGYELLLILAVAEATALQARQQPTLAQREKAIATLRYAGRMGFTTSAYHHRLARVLEMRDDPASRQEAAQHRLKAEGMDPTSATDFFLVAEDLAQQGNWAEAVRKFDGALRLQPDHFWARYFQALCYYRLAQRDTKQNYWLAIKTGMDACIGWKPDFGEAYFIRGTALSFLANLADAEKDFSRAEELLRDRKDPNAHYSLLISRGMARGLNRKLKEAEDDLREAMRLRPRDFLPYLNLGRLYQASGRTEDALREYDQAIARESDILELYRLRARLHIERTASLARNRKQTELAEATRTALADLDAAIRLAGRARTREVAEDHVEKAHLLWRTNRPEEALESCERAIEIQRLLAPAHRLRGELLVSMQRYLEALEPLTTYVALSKRDARLAPPRASVFRARGLALSQLNRAEAALADYSRAIDIEPDAASHVQRGWLHVRLEAPRLARSDFQNAITQDNQCGEAHIALAFVRVVGGDWKNALEGTATGLKHGPKSAPLLYNAARVYSQVIPRLRADASLTDTEKRQKSTELTREALRLIEQAIELQPPARRAGYCKEVIQRDAALAPIADSEGFRLLERRFAQ